MKSIIAGLVLFSASFAFAQGGIGGGSAQDMLNMTKPVEAPKTKSAIRVGVTCKDSDGKNLRQGDLGFEDCLRKGQKDSFGNSSMTPAAGAAVQFGN